MPSPRYVSAASVLVFPPPGRRGRSAWLSPLVIVSLTVSLAGAGTGYTASQRRQPGAPGLVGSMAAVRRTAQHGRVPAPRAFYVAKPKPVVDPLGRLLDDPVLDRLTVGRRPLPLTIVADGKTHTLKSTARTPAELLGDLGIAVGPADRVFPSPRTPLWAGARVRVIRIHRETTAKTIALRVPVVYRPDPTLPRGRVAVTPGKPGVKVQRFQQTFADGRVVSTVYLDQQVLRPSQPRVVRTGTKVLIAARGQFAGHEYLDMLATAYAPWCCRGVDAITATGMRAGYGVVAVDPTVIPLGSVLWIEGYGRAIAGDVGSAIKGLRIDLGMDTTRLARLWGRRHVRVYIIQKSPPKPLRQLPQ